MKNQDADFTTYFIETTSQCFEIQPSCWLISSSHPHYKKITMTITNYLLISYNYIKTYKNLILVGGFNQLEKYEFVNGKDYLIYDMEQ